MTPALILPDRKYEKSYRDYIAELGDEERYPFQMDLEHDDFGALLDRLRDFADGVDIPAGYVPSSTYWLVQGEELVGVSSLRHWLSDELRERGGHIGLGIRPSRRGRGLGSRLLGLTIREARSRDIGDVLIHCYEGNEASARMIERNGGVLQSGISVDGPGEVVQRYVVPAAMGRGLRSTSGTVAGSRDSSGSEA